MVAPDERSDDSQVADRTERDVEEVHTTHHEWAAGDSLLVPIVSGVATVMETEPTSLPPLYEAVDVDNLEYLVRSVPDAARSDFSVSFEFDGCTVHVTGMGDVTVRPSDPVPADD